MSSEPPLNLTLSKDPNNKLKLITSSSSNLVESVGSKKEQNDWVKNQITKREIGWLWTIEIWNKDEKNPEIKNPHHLSSQNLILFPSSHNPYWLEKSRVDPRYKHPRTPESNTPCNARVPIIIM